MCCVLNDKKKEIMPDTETCADRVRVLWQNIVSAVRLTSFDLEWIQVQQAGEYHPAASALLFYQ